MLPAEFSRCDGVRMGQPGAHLCRNCRRAEAGSGDWQQFIAPAMTIEVVGGQAYAECPHYMHAGADAVLSRA